MTTTGRSSVRSRMRMLAAIVFLIIVAAFPSLIPAHAYDHARTPKPTLLLIADAHDGTRSFVTIENAQVREETLSTSYGTLKTSGADARQDHGIKSYLKFTVTELVGQPESVTLWLFVAKDTIKDDLALYVVSSSSWSESSITWASRPGRISTHPGDLGAVSRGVWVEFDVSTVVTDNGAYTFVLAASTSDATDLQSRRASNSPVLVINGAFGNSSPPETAIETATATETPTATAAAIATPLPGRGQLLPIRAAFYYPWFPETWGQSIADPFTAFTPSLGLYDSSDPNVIANHIDAMQYGNIQAGIASWWGPGTQTDQRFRQLLAGAEGTGFKWTVYYEAEGLGDPDVAAIRSDLQHLHDRFASDPSYLRVDGRFVVFVYGGIESCNMVDRWTEANSVNAYIVLKVFSGYRDCANQPDSWHQYGPAFPEQVLSPNSFSISPGFHLHGEAPQLQRDLSRWQQNVQDMVASGADWQLITTFNEWGEGTSVESAVEWESSSGYGQFLDVLHAYGMRAPAPNRTEFRGQGTTLGPVRPLARWRTGIIHVLVQERHTTTIPVSFHSFLMLYDCGNGVIRSGHEYQYQ